MNVRKSVRLIEFDSFGRVVRIVGVCKAGDFR